MRGGDMVRVQHVSRATGKARAMFEKLSPTGGVEDVFPAPGELIRLFADGSPFFIHETGNYRVVLCVQHRYTLESGQFVVVDVQRRNRK